MKKTLIFQAFRGEGEAFTLAFSPPHDLPATGGPQPPWWGGEGEGITLAFNLHPSPLANPPKSPARPPKNFHGNPQGKGSSMETSPHSPANPPSPAQGMICRLESCDASQGQFRRGNRHLSPGWKRLRILFLPCSYWVPASSRTSRMNHQKSP
jgi:hypothetical protein